LAGEAELVTAGEEAHAGAVDLLEHFGIVGLLVVADVDRDDLFQGFLVSVLIFAPPPNDYQRSAAFE
jgi:hypothetical protein